MKFYDGDSDGVKDPGEGGLSGWTIHLDGYATGNFPLHLTAITGSDGKYVFSNIPWGHTPSPRKNGLAGARHILAVMGRTWLLLDQRV